MYIRTSTQKSPRTGKSYATYRLVDTHRTADGKVRQRLILNLGANFSVKKDSWKLLADRIEEILTGQGTLISIPAHLEKQAQMYVKRIRSRFADDNETSIAVNSVSAVEPDFKTVDVNSIESADIRHVGAEALGLHAARQLQLEELFRALGFNQKQCHLMLATIIGRLVAPGSDLSTHYYLSNQSALDELLGTDFSELSLKKFYKTADELLKHKQMIEDQLFEREKNLFSLNQVITLYDITNTYFEGRALQNDHAQHGRSKEKRSDCPLVSLGLVLDGSGFPQRSEFFKGNVSEPKTLSEMLTELHAQPEATIILDAGFATEENISWLTEKGFHYIVVSRRALPVVDENIDKVLVKESVNNTVTAQLIKDTEANEVLLYCHSQAKEEKSLNMISKAETRFEEELIKLANGLTKKTGMKAIEKVTLRLGRIKERHKRVSGRYTITLDSEADKVTKISWSKVNSENLGAYCLRSNRMDLDEKTIWRIYTTLTDVESAFRSLKSELGLRPIYHQKQERVDAHLFISILAYHLLHTIRHQLKLQSIDSSWQTIRQIFSTQVRIMTTMRLENNKLLSVRRTSKATPEQVVIYKSLGMNSQPGHTEKTIC